MAQDYGRREDRKQMARKSTCGGNMRQGWAGRNADVPDDVEAERRRAVNADRTANMMILGDPLPGRSALERRA
jgi:hypothetical protein